MTVRQQHGMYPPPLRRPSDDGEVAAVATIMTAVPAVRRQVSFFFSNGIGHGHGGGIGRM